MLAGLTVGFILLGAVLAQRFAWLIVLPATLVALGITGAALMAFPTPNTSLLLAFGASVAGLQGGYVCGALFRRSHCRRLKA